MTDNEDWRLLNEVDHLHNAPIDPTDNEEINLYRPDLNHCVFCWESVPKKLAYNQRWYIPVDKSCVICERCFEDFREHFHWRLLDSWDIEWG